MDYDTTVDVTDHLLPEDRRDVGECGNIEGAILADKSEQILQIDQDEEEEGLLALREAIPTIKLSQSKNVRSRKGGTFHSMGLDMPLLKAISRKGFSIPTPIQRKAIPAILDDRDVVGMARTGSGKTAAFVIPMIQKLKVHSAQVGARAVILSPSRELATQTLKVVKELGRGTALRSVLLVGGDSLEDDFSSMMTNPDIIIATPGRFLHLKIEMNMDFSSVQYVVFDEADRLFEMGFAAQLGQILLALPSSRQTLLFSATLPKSLVEFARAGLQDPQLLRLDAESKVSPDLCSAFFLVKPAEREGALLHILQDLIKMPTGPTGQISHACHAPYKEKQIRSAQETPTNHSTLIFVPTKHHVEYLTALLRAQGYAVSLVYGSLDQTARKMNVESFRSGETNILIVTDVAARGIDIPLLANVVNYGFPSQPKIFVHRVGRTARAGKTGWSYNLLGQHDLPYLLDLQLFLGKKLVVGGDFRVSSCANDVVLGCLLRDKMERHYEAAYKLLDTDVELSSLRDVAAKGEKLYLKSRNNASSESVRRAKDLSKDTAALTKLHPLFLPDSNEDENKRQSLLTRMGNFRPQETVFEIGKRGNTNEMIEGIRKRRRIIDIQKPKGNLIRRVPDLSDLAGEPSTLYDELRASDVVVDQESVDELSETECEVTMRQDSDKPRNEELKSGHDAENYMSYLPKTINLEDEQRYGVHSGSGNSSKSNASFFEAARHATLDLNHDEIAGFAEPSRLRWNKKSKKYMIMTDGSDSGMRANSGRKEGTASKVKKFEAWKKSQKIDRLPRVGEKENNATTAAPSVMRRYRHKAEKAPKIPDKKRNDYHKKMKKFEAAKEKRMEDHKGKAKNGELRSIDAMQKARKLKQRRRNKNARPSKQRKA